MPGISPQWYQFCRFIWRRNPRGSEYFVHCLFMYHVPRATDIDNAALYPARRKASPFRAGI